MDYNGKTNLIVSTCIEESWNVKSRHFFLGEWCKQLSRKPHWDKLSFKTAKYHWNNRNKLEEDYLYSKKLYQKLILELGENLNDYYKISHSNRYWKIIIGPWLLSFIQIILERYENLRQLKDYSEKFETIIIKINKNI